MSMSGRVVLVTGGAGGIGGACAKRLAGDGAQVVITDIVEEQKGQSVAESFGGSYMRHDASSLQQWQEVASAVVEQHGGIHGLVNCAGIEGSIKVGGLDTTEEDWKRVIDINLNGSFWGLKAVMPQMQKHGSGSIVLLSSIVSYMCNPSGIAYGASKAGVAHLARSAAYIGAQDGHKIRCNSVHPGIIKSRMTDNIIDEIAAASGNSAEAVETEFCKQIPLGERGLPDDVAGLVSYLLSDDSRYVTGSEYKIDGGWSMVSAG